MSDDDGAVASATASEPVVGSATEPSLQEAVTEPKRKGRLKPEVEINFQAANIIGATFGLVNGPTSRPTPATVRKKAADVAAEIACYVPPDCFAEASIVLKDEHMLVLQGPPGIGKGTGALALLHVLMKCDIVPIQPTITFEELRSIGYEAGVGYVILGHTSYDHQGVDAEYQRTTLREVVRQAKARLVITTTGTTKHLSQVKWQRPDKLRFLFEFLKDFESATAMVDNLSKRVPNNWTVANLAECARRVKARPDQLDDALEVFDLATIHEVQTWFDTPHERRDIAEVTALAFGWGTSERRFETLVTALENRLAIHIPTKKSYSSATSSTEPDSITQGRKGRRDGTGLVQVERTTVNAISRRVMVFKSPQHWLHVLTELWARYEAAFWDAVREWLHDLLDNTEVVNDQIVSAAEGLGYFAEVDFDETLGSFLEPLSSGDAGLGGMMCAAGALCAMSRKDALAPLALQVAVRWVDQSDRLQRATAAWALMADVGMRYPAEAARRLWQLITQDHALSDDAIFAPAILIANLVEAGSDAFDVLDLLDRQVIRFSKPGTEVRMVDLTLNTVLCVLSVPGVETNRTAIFDLLAVHPDRADLVARLWVGALRNRRGFRVRALDAMWGGLKAARDLERDTNTLADALFRALPPDEREAFARDFRAMDVRKRQKDKTSAESIAELLIKALDRKYSRKPEKERDV